MSRNLPLPSRPTVKELDLKLKGLVRWQRFAIHLPTIELSDIKEIELNNAGNIENQRLVLFGRWLRKCTNASWLDVVSALKIIDENVLAEIIRGELLSCVFFTCSLKS